MSKMFEIAAHVILFTVIAVITVIILIATSVDSEASEPFPAYDPARPTSAKPQIIAGDVLGLSEPQTPPIDHDPNEYDQPADVATVVSDLSHYIPPKENAMPWPTAEAFAATILSDDSSGTSDKMQFVGEIVPPLTRAGQNKTGSEQTETRQIIHEMVDQSLSERTPEKTNVNQTAKRGTIKQIFLDDFRFAIAVSNDPKRRSVAVLSYGDICITNLGYYAGSAGVYSKTIPSYCSDYINGDWTLIYPYPIEGESPNYDDPEKLTYLFSSQDAQPEKPTVHRYVMLGMVLGVLLMVLIEVISA